MLAIVGCGGPSRPPAVAGQEASRGDFSSEHEGERSTGRSAQDAGGSAPAAERPKMNPTAALAYVQGLQAFGFGDLVAAKAAFERAIESDSQAYQAHYSLGVVHERLGAGQSALASYRKALTIVSDYEPAIAAHALLQARRGQRNEAERFIEDRLAKMPESAVLLATIAELKSMANDTASAQRYAQEALKKDPSCAPAMIVIARDHYRHRRIDLALYALRAILDGFGDHDPPRDRDNGDALYLRALIYHEQGQRGPAIEAFKRVIAVRPDLVDARVALAQYYLEAGNANEALPLLEGAIRYEMENIPARLAIGDCYRLLGRIEEARSQLQWVLQKDPSLAQANYNLALLYLFSPSVAGMDAKAQTLAAISEIETYQKKRGRAAEGDDSEELLNRARQRLADIEAQLAVSEPVSVPTAPDSSL